MADFSYLKKHINDNNNNKKHKNNNTNNNKNRRYITNSSLIFPNHHGAALLIPAYKLQQKNNKSDLTSLKTKWRERQIGGRQPANSYWKCSYLSRCGKGSAGWPLLSRHKWAAGGCVCRRTCSCPRQEDVTLQKR